MLKNKESESSLGFGLGSFGGIDDAEAFGSVGTEVVEPPVVKDTAVLSSEQKGASIFGLKKSVFITMSGVIELGRVENIDCSCPYLKSNRNLIFE